MKGNAKVEHSVTYNTVKIFIHVVLLLQYKTSMYNIYSNKKR